MSLFWRLVPVIVSCILMAAHLSRAGMGVLALTVLALPLLLLARRPWSARTVQLALVVFGFEWLRSIWAIASRRIAAGEPWLRMALILAVVTAFTWASALAIRSPVMRGTRSEDQPEDQPENGR